MLAWWLVNKSILLYPVPHPVAYILPFIVSCIPLHCILPCTDCTLHCTLHCTLYRKLMDGLRCIDDFTTSCLDDDHRAYFNTLYTGTTQVIMDLCQTGQYQTGERLT